MFHYQYWGQEGCGFDSDSGRVQPVFSGQTALGKTVDHCISLIQRCLCSPSSRGFVPPPLWELMGGVFTCLPLASTKTSRKEICSSMLALIVFQISALLMSARLSGGRFTPTETHTAEAVFSLPHRSFLSRVAGVLSAATANTSLTILSPQRRKLILGKQSTSGGYSTGDNRNAKTRQKIGTERVYWCCRDQE